MNPGRRRFLAGAAATAACGGFTPSTFGAAGTRPFSLTMQLDWVFNAQFAGLILADHLGLYREADLDVTLTQWDSGTLVTDAMVEDPTTLGCAEQNLVLAARAAGTPVKAIATMFQASPLSLMSLPDTPIASPDALRGKKIAMHVDGLKVVDLVLAANGIARDSVEITTVTHEHKFDALAAGTFDAVQCYAVDEPIDFEMATGVAPVVMPLGPLGHDAYAQVIFAHDTLLAEHPDRVMAFLTASFDGWRRALAERDTTARIIVEHYADPTGKYADLDYQRRSLDRVAEFVLADIHPARMGALDDARWRRTAATFAEHGIIPALPDIGASIDGGLWPPG